MAVTVTINKRFKFGNGFGVVADVLLDDSYPTGGESIDAGKFGLQSLDFVIPSPSGGYIFEYDHANKKLKGFTPTKAQTAHTHTENTDDTYTKNATTGSGGAVTAAAATEIANATSLSTVTVRVIAIGI